MTGRPTHKFIEAINTDNWNEFYELAHPNIKVSLTARDGLSNTINEELWRSVKFSGHEELAGYIKKINMACASISIKPESIIEEEACVRLPSKFAGVNSQGKLFALQMNVLVCEEQDQIISFYAEVTDVQVGSHLFQEENDDLRMYFRPLLNKTSN
jgi:hypothetical protein